MCSIISIISGTSRSSYTDMKNYYYSILVLISLVTSSQAVCSPIYGKEPCLFLPAPPGKTPPCARPGLTYCEFPDHYPGQLIQYLVQQWKYDHHTLIGDESKEEFSSYFYPPATYGLAHGYGMNGVNQDSYLPEPIHIPKPRIPAELYNGDKNSYILPQFKNAQNFSEDFKGYPDRRPSKQNGEFLRYKYTSNIPKDLQLLPNNHFRPQNFKQPSVDQYFNQDIWNRNLENVHEPFHARLKRADEERVTLRRSRQMMHRVNNLTDTTGRYRRQTRGSPEPLCTTRSQYIMPRAALNNKGDWMYVVNMEENSQKYTQLVKSETCVSQTCSSICGLPNGYTSRCEQKYVQKRLVALEGAGNQLYSDVFWFPSCCVCTISNN